MTCKITLMVIWLLPQLTWFEIKSNNQEDYYMQENYVNSQNLVVEFWVRIRNFMMKNSR